MTKNLFLLFCLAFQARAATLDVYPAQIQLDRADDTLGLVLVQTREDGVTLDVTRSATATFAQEGIARWSGEQGRLLPVGDGETQLTLAYGGQSIQVGIKVQNATKSVPVSFKNDVEPVLMKAGCNTGSCHGSARGKNGFALSLFGYDPAKDYLALTREIRGRRLNAAVPHESLMLLKATGHVDHEGGTRFENNTHLYATIARWIEEGAREDSADLPTLAGLEILPRECVLEGKGSTQQFTVRVSYSDGTDRDVTSLALLASSDDAVVGVDNNGLATARERGETYLLARFGTIAVVAQVIVIPQGGAFEWPDLPVRNYVDEHIFAKLKKLRVPPAELCSDEVFVRRLYLDTLGVLPTVEEAKSFLSDSDPDKRTKLIDRLLERPEFVEVWATKWADVLMVKSLQANQRKAMHRYNDWLRQSIGANMPMGRLATEILTAQGGTFTTPAANFYDISGADPTVLAERVAQVFMGVQIKCAQCHNHPFDRWTMDDYYSFAAFFAQIGTKQSEDPRERIVFHTGSGEVRNKRDNQPMAPKFLGGPAPDLAGKDPRIALADWLSGPDNPWFAKNIANRAWQHFFGTGIIDPVDDVRVTNPPSHPELLEVLAAQLISYDYDLRRLIRDIASSSTYQLSTKPSPNQLSDPRNFSVAGVRRLPAEQLLDAIADVTETKFKFPNLPLGARAIQVANGNSGNYFLELFGRPPRENVCTCERRGEPTLAQALHLINGDTVGSAVKSGEGRLSRLVSSTTDTAAILDEIYLAAFSRFPTEEDKRPLVEYVAKAEDRIAALEDVFWGVLNSKEFIFNH